MKRLFVVFMLLTIQAALAEPPALICNIGPTNRSFGGTAWLVYACSDKRSVVVVSAPGNPAAPSYFMFSYEKDGYRLRSEGTGNKDATSTAYDELKTFRREKVLDLLNEAISKAQ